MIWWSWSICVDDDHDDDDDDDDDDDVDGTVRGQAKTFKFQREAARVKAWSA